MYKKVTQSDFDIEEHINEKLARQPIRLYNTGLWLANTAFTNSARNGGRGMGKVNTGSVRYKDFIEINAMHTIYISELRGNMSPNAFLPVLYKAELTGAKVTILSGINKTGIIVEERENVILMVFEDDRIKCYPKNTIDFTFAFDGVDYIFLGDKMKKNRFFKR
jgi:ribonuclease P protein subunit POP4